MQIMRRMRQDHESGKKTSTAADTDRLADTSDRTAALEDKVATLEQMLGSAPVNIVTCDVKNDFTIDFMNDATRKTLATLEHLLPCKVDELLGRSVDIFHADPSHQRRILSDPSNLPHQAQIKLGDEILELLVTAVHDRAGNYIKAMLTWSVVTEKVKADARAAQLTQMVEGMPIGVMMTDKENFEITYMNKFSTDTLKTLESYLPVKVDAMIGQCIDVFHKVPSHQRRILADPKNLPHQANIEVGPEILDLLISPIFDKNGDYMGPMLTWSVVTAKVKADAESAKLLQMLDVMPVNIMMADPTDLTITYINSTSKETLRPLQSLLPVPIDQLLGTCIDVFHENPSVQRRILGDPNNLPHQANITLGEHTLSLEIAAIRDKAGVYLGPMLTWSVITAQVNIAKTVAEVTQVVASNATELEATAQALSATSEETSRQAASVASAAEQATVNVETVAAASEELAASVTEISRLVSESHKRANQAVEQANHTNDSVNGLAEAAQKIGAVVNMINDIASQTNLLALNATIEAARAGEAGKGFAVVASEVKALANQTAKATEEISAQITSMQATTRDTVTAIGAISEMIESIAESSTAVASAVEEQQASTQEISRNVQEAASGTKEVSQNIAGVNQAASESGAASNQVLESSAELLKQTNMLQTEISQFLLDLKIT